MLKATMILFAIFIIFQIIYIFIPIFSVRRQERFKKSSVEKPTSVLIPAYNEEKIILNCLKGVLNVNYKNFEVIIINDGSTDFTFQLLHNQLQLEMVARKKATKIPHEEVTAFYQSNLYPHIYVLDKKTGEKQML